MLAIYLHYSSPQRRCTNGSHTGGFIGVRYTCAISGTLHVCAGSRTFGVTSCLKRWLGTAILATWFSHPVSTADMAGKWSAAGCYAWAQSLKRGVSVHIVERALKWFSKILRSTSPENLAAILLPSSIPFGRVVLWFNSQWIYTDYIFFVGGQSS